MGVLTIHQQNKQIEQATQIFEDVTNTSNEWRPYLIVHVEERLQPGFLGSCYQGFNSTAKAWTASEWDGDSGAVSILQEANELKKKVSEELYQLNRAIV
ncbi:hypothetical protein FocTR4_00003940 [Fusarium oxysporum f. sp. cubense]|uniref:Uncharacterized protein n=1 Tax=Fusarium oxysporum f. sp. cubense TaxID=61366 RepID=A0A5C6T9Z0_FUSOC|nr:hypothetical protein FocTR4_00003940 [Fusarium oxysporum f. sp. cubense]